MNNLIYVAIIITVSLLASRSYSVRVFLLGIVYSLMTLSTYVFVSPERLRVAVVIALLITGHKEIARVLVNRYARRMFVSVMLWYAYLAISNSMIGNLPTTQPRVYITIGNIVLYLLTITYIIQAKYKHIWILLSGLFVGYFSNIVAYMPRVIPLFAMFSHASYFHHGVVGLSCFRCMPLLLFASSYVRNKPEKVAVFSTMFVVAIMAYLSGSRTGLMGTFIVLILYRRSLKWFLAVLIFALSVFLLLGPQTESEWATQRYERLYLAFKSGDPESVSEVEFRLSHFRIGVNAFLERPIAGYGYGSWDEIRGSSMSIIGSSLASHNAYAVLLGETGLVGIVLFSLVIISHLRGLPISPGSRLSETLGYISLLIILSFLILGVYSSSFWYRDFSVFLGFANAAKVRELQYLSILKSSRDL